MRMTRRCMTIIAAAALCALCALSAPAAHAATDGSGAHRAAVSKPAATHGTVVSVLNGSSYEYIKSCSNTSPYPCGTYNQQLSFTIYTTNQGSAPITIGYQTVDGSAVAGVDYQAASGTVTIQPSFPQAYVSITVFNDGVAESNETMQLKLTSTSSPADISSVGTGTIWDGGQTPIDCNLSKNAPGQESMTCTNRPATQTWYLDVECRYPLGDPELIGNQVTGNGTSAGTCSIGYTVQDGVYFQTV